MRGVMLSSPGDLWVNEWDAGEAVPDDMPVCLLLYLYM